MWLIINSATCPQIFCVRTTEGINRLEDNLTGGRGGGSHYGKAQIPLDPDYSLPGIKGHKVKGQNVVGGRDLG